MMNGTGLRVCLWCSGCDHHCRNCQNPITWNPNDGVQFDESAKKEILDELSKDYISGITFTGGDPLYSQNLKDVLDLITDLRSKYPISRKIDTIYRENDNFKYNILIKNSDEIRLSCQEKTIWLYSGYTWEQIMHPIITDDFNIKRDQLLKMRQDIVKQCDVLVDGRYEEDKRDVTYHWAGSTNQRVIDVQETLKQGKVILWENQ
jgi:anaerobic ribonucleoside-triphosphate reductase activating protein